MSWMDPCIDRDIALLECTRKKAVVDYVKWFDTEETIVYKNDIHLKRLGHRATFHDLGPKQFTELPPTVLSRPVMGLEVSLDFYPPRSHDRAKAATLMNDTFMLLQRRIILSDVPTLSNRIHIYWPSGKNETLRKSTSIDRGWVKETTMCRVVSGKVQSNGNIAAPTVYYGDKPEIWFPGDTGRSQVRLYIKKSDNGENLPRHLWRTRLEVTLDQLACNQILQVTTIGELRNAPFRKLANTHFRLGIPKPILQSAYPLRRGRGRPRRGAQNAVTALVSSSIRERSIKDCFDAAAQGNVAFLDVGNVDFRVHPRLTGLIRTPLTGLSRALNSAQIVAGATTGYANPSLAKLFQLLDFL